MTVLSFPPAPPFLPTSTMTPLLFYVIATRLKILTSFPPLEKMGKH